jgi:acyl carrier protein
MDQIETGVRRLLAEVLELDPELVNRLPAGTSLFGGELNLGSLAGARLLAEVDARFGVDIGVRDWELASLTSIATLTDFVRAEQQPRP